MKTINPSLPDMGWKLIPPIIPAIIPLKKIKVKHDIVLNVDFQGAMIRSGFVLLIPMLTAFTDTNLIIYISPVIIYLFISALIQFCIVKYVWHRYIRRDLPKPIKYGKDPHYPEESV